MWTRAVNRATHGDVCRQSGLGRGIGRQERPELGIHVGGSRWESGLWDVCIIQASFTLQFFTGRCFSAFPPAHSSAFPQAAAYSSTFIPRIAGTRYFPFCWVPHIRCIFTVIYGHFLGVLPIWRKPGISDKTRTGIHIWGRCLVPRPRSWTGRSYI